MNKGGSTVLREISLKDYHIHYYPFESVVRMLKMDRSSSLLQYRALTLQSATFWKKHFNRVTDKLLRNAIIQHNKLALHIGPFILSFKKGKEFSMRGLKIIIYQLEKEVNYLSIYVYLQ
jgi:hypothetical protein